MGPAIFQKNSSLEEGIFHAQVLTKNIPEDIKDIMTLSKHIPICSEVQRGQKISEKVYQ